MNDLLTGDAPASTSLGDATGSVPVANSINRIPPTPLNASHSLNISVLGKLPKFDGRSSVKKFLKAVEKRSQLEKWSNEDKARIVIYLCTDLAEAYIDSHPEVEHATYAELCILLTHRFQPKISKPEAYSELMSIKQNRQSIDDFAGHIESTAANLSDVITELQDADARDELLISVFMSGLDPPFKRSLIVTEYDEFSELVRAAKRFEKTFNNERRTVNSIDNRREQHNRPSNERLNNNRPSNDRQFAHGSNIQCWTCGQRGHISRDCRRFTNHEHKRLFDNVKHHYSTTDNRRFNDSKN